MKKVMVPSASTMPPNTAYWAQPPRSVEDFGATPLLGSVSIDGGVGDGRSASVVAAMVDVV